ncbi:MAG: hypothetical protein PHD11_07460 [Bacteroidales bacterium]|nr:hypothetical protein [Bacteroidales bacterium]
MDFTLKAYKSLICALKEARYAFLTFDEFLSEGQDWKCVVLRHDVDKLPFNSLRIARIEAEEGVCSTYYFRAVPESWNEVVIREIAGMGHEVGYHYESLTTCGGDVDAAYADFCANLEKLRQIVPVKTICMHGSPRSPYDSKDIWKKYDYRKSGIVGEPYLDVNFGEVFYLTDTGRRWDGYKVSVRDKIPGYQEEWNKAGLVFRTTSDVIRGVEEGMMPEKIMITTHPQRWEEFGWKWAREMVVQGGKNAVKRMIVWGKRR